MRPCGKRGCQIVAHPFVVQGIFRPVSRQGFRWSRHRGQRISVERWVFTTAHELGHLLLHLDAYDVDEVKEDEAEEREADVFASHFLMPEGVFRREWHETRGLPLVHRILKLKRMFHVSYRTVLYRLIENGTFDEQLWPRFYTAYRRETGKSLGAAREPDALSPDFSRISTNWLRKNPTASPNRTLYRTGCTPLCAKL